MTPKLSKQQDIILQVVRGQRPCEDLSQLGIHIERVDGAWHFKSPPLEALQLEIVDVANGLLKLKEHPDALQKWTRFLLCGLGFIDFSKCERHSEWQVLLDALWDAMDSGSCSDATFHLAEELAK